MSDRSTKVQHSVVKNDLIVLQAVGLFAFTNLLWSGHRVVAQWIHFLWGQPAAYIAGLFFWQKPSLIDGSWVIPVSGTLVRVTRECDAFGFFSLIVSVSVVHILSRYQSRPVFKWAAVAATVAGAYLLTILLNGIRIVGAYYVHAWAQALSLEKFQGLLHLGVGVMVFLPVLCAVIIYWERELFYE